MAFTPNNYLYLTSNVTLRDPQHAARLFVDDQFRLLPKTKFLFHVAFNINQAALQNISLVERHRNEINMLVKNVDLPNFKMNAETLNQYNRKKNIYSSIKYEPLNITFHDDNMGVINQLWQNYFSYYVADPLSATVAGAYNRNATKSYDYIPTNYGLDNGSKLPFFNYIKIYQLARHEYVSYTLHNPIITTWNHNKLDYAQGNTSHDNQAQIQYEAVSYDSGSVELGDPEGFGLEHYDQTPSPLQGSSDAIRPSPSFADSNSTINQAILNTVTEQLNTYQNTQEKLNGGSKVLTNVIQTAKQGVSGIQGIAFPVSVSGNNNTVVATQINIIGK